MISLLHTDTEIDWIFNNFLLLFTFLSRYSIEQRSVPFIQLLPNRSFWIRPRPIQRYPIIRLRQNITKTILPAPITIHPVTIYLVIPFHLYPQIIYPKIIIFQPLHNIYHRTRTHCNRSSVVFSHLVLVPAVRDHHVVKAMSMSMSLQHPMTSLMTRRKFGNIRSDSTRKYCVPHCGELIC